MRKLLLLLSLVLTTSCGAILEQQREFLATPEGQEYARQRFVLDSINAVNNGRIYGVYNGYRVYYNHGFDYYFNRGFNRVIHYDRYGRAYYRVGNGSRSYLRNTVRPRPPRVTPRRKPAVRNRRGTVTVTPGRVVVKPKSKGRRHE